MVKHKTKWMEKKIKANPNKIKKERERNNYSYNRL